MSDVNHTDQTQDLAMLQPLVDAVVQLAERLQQLETFVHEDFVGGIKKLYQTNVRNEGIDGLKSKYGDQIDQFAPNISSLFGPDYDTYGQLHDHLQNLKAGDGEWNDEKEGGAVSDLVSKLKGAFGGPAEGSPEEEAAESPEAEAAEQAAIETGKPVAVKKEAITVAAKPMSDKEKLIKQVLAVKNRK